MSEYYYAVFFVDFGRRPLKNFSILRISRVHAFNHCQNVTTRLKDLD